MVSGSRLAADTPRAIPEADTSARAAEEMVVSGLRSRCTKPDARGWAGRQARWGQGGGVGARAQTALGLRPERRPDEQPKGGPPRAPPGEVDQRPPGPEHLAVIDVRKRHRAAAHARRARAQFR